MASSYRWSNLRGRTLALDLKVKAIDTRIDIFERQTNAKLAEVEKRINDTPKKISSETVLPEQIKSIIDFINQQEM